MEYQKKNKTIIFKCTTEEHQKLVEAQEKAGHSHLSEYIRAKLLETKTESKHMEILKLLRILEERE